MTVIIDTNVLLVSVSRRSKYNWLYQAVLEKKFHIAFTTEILTEYEEPIGKHWHPDLATDVVRSLLELSTSRSTIVYFNLRFITADEDDNKFIDCAFASNADFIVSNDSDFNILKKTAFPSITVVTIDTFKKILIDRNII